MRSIITCLALCAPFAHAWIRNCNEASAFQIRKLDLVPDPPIPGAMENLTLVFDNYGSAVYDGTAETSATVNFIPMPKSTKPLCESTECPIEPGLNDRSTGYIWPPEVKGKIRSKIVWKGVDGANLLCIETEVSVA